MIYGMVMSVLELGVPMAFYAYEKIKNERARRRELQEELRIQSIAEGRAEGIAEGRAEGRAEGIAEGRAETIDAIRAKLEDDPDLSPEELIEALVADMRDNGDRPVRD